jgi:hypothetical protein
MAETIVLEKFDLDPNLDGEPDDEIIKIQGRRGSIMTALLSILGLPDRSFITITRREVSFEFTSVRGIILIVAPLKAVTCSLSGVQKPFGQLVAGVIIFLGSLWAQNSHLFSTTLTLVGLVIGAALMVNYVRVRNLMITFSTGDMGDVQGLAFQATTTLDGKKVEIEQIRKAIEHINYHIVNAQLGKYDE